MSFEDTSSYKKHYSLKVLIVSFECWRDDTNGGSVLSNLFEEQDMELAQIYCKPGLPQNRACRRYYRMDDKMALKGCFSRSRAMGEILDYSVWPNHSTQKGTEKKFYDFFRKHDWAVFQIIRETIWWIAPWKNQKLKDFIEQFAPDVIFAPCYANLFMLRLDRWVKQVAKVPMVSYISDDNYSLKQMRFSPFYWIHRFLIRRSIRKTARKYALMYTMTEAQAQELSKELHVDMKILRKCGEPFASDANADKVEKREQVRFIYAGGTYLGRDEILVEVAQALTRIKKDEGIDCRLDIYTTSPMKSKIKKILNDGQCSFVHEPVTMDVLKKRYAQSDVALHVESFKKKYALQTRLSFSTKIVDCLASGCAILAICPSINAGWQYLKQEDAAVCIDDLDAIYQAVHTLICRKKERESYSQKARCCILRNHNKVNIKQGLYKELLQVKNK